MDLEKLATDFSAIEQILIKSAIYEDAKKELISSIAQSTMSQERQTGLIQQFTSQVALGFPELIFNKIIQLRDLESQVELRVEQKNEVIARKELLQKQKDTELEKKNELSKEIELKECLRQKCIEEKDFILVQKYERMGSASKQLGLLVTHSSWLDQANGLIDKQIVGFSGDMRHKILKSLSEQAGMLAQNSVATPPWMTTEMQDSIAYMKGV